MNPRVRGVLLLASIVVYSCGDADRTGAGAADQGPVLVHPGAEGGMEAVVEGELSLTADGCLLLGDWPVVWPQDTKWNEDNQSVVLPSGEEVAMGGIVTGGGGYYDSAERVAASPLGEEIAAAVEPCLSGTGAEVAVFNPGEDVAILMDR